MAFGVDDALALGGSLIGGIAGSSEEDKANELANKATRISLADFQARLPLRGIAIDRLLAGQPQRENLNAMFDDPGNVYQRDMTRPPTALPMPGQGQPGGPGGPVPLGGGSSLLPPVTGGSSLPLSMGDRYQQSVLDRAGLPGGRPGDHRAPNTNGLGNMIQYFKAMQRGG